MEGKDDSAVVQSLCEKHHVPEVFKVQSKDGVDELLGMFYTELRAPGADRFGVVVDANGNAQARWDSIRHTLEAEGYAGVPHRPAPDGIILPGTEHRPMFGAWIMPDNGSPGALEDFAAALVPGDDPLWSRAGEAVDAIPAEHRPFRTFAGPRLTSTRGSHGRNIRARRWARRSARATWMRTPPWQAGSSPGFGG
ncbi:MAG TPA: DUF3226 domain-containing protein [Longimicrobium sp.]